MAPYRIEFTEDAKLDLSYYTAYERKVIVSALREQLTYQPSVETANRKHLYQHPIATWELRTGKYRSFYETNEMALLVVIVAVGHKISQPVVYSGQGGTVMRVIELTSGHPNLIELLQLARQEPVLLLTDEGEEFLLAEADDFEQEVATLRANPVFQRFLQVRSASQSRFSLDAIEREIDDELALQANP